MRIRIMQRFEISFSGCINQDYLSHIARKPVFSISDQDLHIPRCTAREWLEACNFRFRKERDCSIYFAKTKALIS